MEFDSVTHRNHGFGALVVVEHMMNGFAGATVDCFRVFGVDHAGASTAGIEGEFQCCFRVGSAEFSFRSGRQLSRDQPLRLDDKFAIADVKTHRSVRLCGVSVFARENVEFGC
jgi:hypothetical protein